MYSCSSTKYVPNNEKLLCKVKIESNSKNIVVGDFENYIRQKPNSKLFNLIKAELYIYNMSGKKNSGWNRFLRRIGEAPVIYNEEMTQLTKREMTKEMNNLGYMSATVDVIKKHKKRKIDVKYVISAGQPHIIESFTQNVSDEKLMSIIETEKDKSFIRKGDVFNTNKLDEERIRIANLIRNKGYYDFTKEYVTFIADTVSNTKKVNLTMNVSCYNKDNKDKEKTIEPYTISRIKITEDLPFYTQTAQKEILKDSITYNEKVFEYIRKPYISPRVLDDMISFNKGDLYNEQKLQRTYSNLIRLSAIRYANIRYTKKPDNTLECLISITRNKDKNISFSIEGTNSASDYGAALSVNFQNRNLFKGSELFQIKLRGAYEKISGLKQGYFSNNFREYGIETSINFPRFLFPFLRDEYKKSIRANTEFGFQFNNQLRPEFTRTLLNTFWSYKWSNNRKSSHRFDLINISFLYLPSISERFREEYIKNGNSLFFTYNYQDRFIINWGYYYYYNSDGNANVVNRPFNPRATTFRVGVEFAGNLMNGVSKIFNFKKNENGEYKLFNVPYSQYLKINTNYLKSFRFDKYNSISLHLGLGLAIPYGNSKTIPFEKQFFSGGANSVRGWSIRELGPGAYIGNGDLLTKSGEIKLDVNLEYRTKLFWKFRGAAFIDAGNVWNIRTYKHQPNGVFRFNKFYKQIAVAYGLGIRLDADILVVRLDGGMKAINPMYDSGKDRYPIINPNFKRDFALHIAVGYPF